jgi:hypothetical protein
VSSFILTLNLNGETKYVAATGTPEEAQETVGTVLDNGAEVTGFIPKELIVGMLAMIYAHEKTEPLSS